jgi:hypothetical protein
MNSNSKLPCRQCTQAFRATRNPRAASACLPLN